MRDRGGITDAQIRGIDATTGLKRAEYEITRGLKSDALAERGMVLRESEATQRKERWGLEKPELEAKAKEAAYQNEEININAKDVIPPSQSGFLHTFTPRTKDGKSLFDDMNEGLEGSGWDDKTGNRIRSDGSFVKMPRWKWEQKYKPAMMFTYLSKTDPVKLINDKIYEAKQSLDASPQGTAEYTQRKAQYDKISSVLSDKVQMASLYGKKVEAISEGIAWGIANNADPKYLSMLSGELADSRSKFDKHSARLTETEKLKIKELEASIKQKEAAAKKALAEAKDIAGGGKKSLNEYQSGRLAGEAWKIVNGEIKTKVDGMDQSWAALSSDKQTEWANNRYTEVLKTLMPKTKADVGAGLKGGGPKILTGRAAVKRSQELISGIDSGAINTEQLLESLRQSGQNEVGRQIVAHLKAKMQEQSSGLAGTPVRASATAGLGALPGRQSVPPQDNIAGLGYEGLDTQSALTGQAVLTPEEQALRKAYGPNANMAELRPDQLAPALPSSELIPGMGGNIAALKSSIGEAAKVLGDFARAMGLQTKEEAAQQLADFTGVPVENINSMQPNKLAELINAVLASQAEAQQTVGNVQPYGFR